MLNARSQNVKLNAPIKAVNYSTVLNVSPFANNLIASLIAKLPSLSVNPFAKSLNATGNAINQTAPNPNVNWFVKILIVFLKLSAVLVLWELLESLSLSPSSRKLSLTKTAANVSNKAQWRIVLIMRYMKY